MTKSGSFLESLAEEDRTALAARWGVRRHAAKEVVVGHGEETREVFFMLTGRARITVYSEGGKAVAFRDVGPGGIFGEVAAIDGGPRSASVVTLEAAEIAVLPQPEFRQLVNSRPGFTWALLAYFALQMRDMTERVYEYSTLVVRKRLLRELLRLAEDRAGGQGRISPAPTHFDLASRISTHREAVSREMSALARRKLVERREGALILNDLQELERLCGGED